MPIKNSVCRNLQAILDIDFLEEYDCVFWIARSILEINHKQSKLHGRISESRCARVAVVKTVHIGPEQAVIIQRTVKLQNSTPGFFHS